MITRIAVRRVSSPETPTCNRSKSRATMQHHTKITNITATSIPAGQQNAVRHATRNRVVTTLCRCSLAALQVLVFACALPPPLQPLLPTPAVEALPITSKPIESTAENLAWQAWLMLPPEQKQLEKSRKVTPKSIFSLPFRDCPPGHQLFQSRCIPTVNINQSDLLAQQVLGLLVGSTAGGAGGAGSDNAYEFDYEDEEYGLGFGEGEPVVMYESPQPFSGSSSTAGSGNAQQPPARDEPLKFNLFEQKYPTSDYEADLSSSTLEGSGSARPLNEQLPAQMSTEGDRVGASSNESDGGATFYNSSQFLDAVQGFFQRHTTASDESTGNTTSSNATISDPNIRNINASNTERQHQGLSDLHVASSNISTFAVGDIDAIILPAVGAGMSATTIASRNDEAVGGSVGANAAAGNLEPQRISLFKDDSTVQLETTVIAQSDNNRRKGGEDTLRAGVEDLVTAAQQHHNTVAQFLRADALLPLSSAAPYITTTTPNTHALAEDEADQGAKPLPLAAKDEHPRSVTQKSSATAAAAAPTDTDAQETSFITTTEPEGTTSFQIDETTVVEADEESATLSEAIPLLEAISKQQQLEFQKSKVEPVEEETPITTTIETVVNEETTTADDDNTTIATKTIPNETVETTTAKEAYETSEKSVEKTTLTETTTQPLPSAGALSPTITATTTKAHLTTTANANRFRSSPAAVVAPIRLATDKKVSGIVNSATAPPVTIDPHVDEETEASDIDIVSDVLRSGNNDLVNVAASSINGNSDTNNDSSNKSKSNKKSPVRFAASAKTKAVVAASELNIEQELRMINELVKGKRQLAALKMAAIKATTTTTQASTAIQTSTASESKLEMKKSAIAAENEQNARGAAAVEVRPEATTITAEVATLRAEATTVASLPLIASSGSENEVLHTVTATTAEAVGTKVAAQKEATTTAKMESDSQLAETTTVLNTAAAEALNKHVELATTSTTTATASADPDFEAEATAASAEATDATLWSRIMPLFGFGRTVVEAGATAEAVSTAVTPTAAPAAEKIAGSTSIGSISSSNVKSSISSDSISDISSIGKNLNNNNFVSNNNKHIDGHIRRNSKIIRIDQLSDNSVAATAAAATTTNTLEEEATAMKIATATTATMATITTAMTNTKSDSVATAPEAEPAEQSSYWWLPAGWRSHRDTNDGQQPLLFRLWSAFPESHMKAKTRT